MITVCCCDDAGWADEAGSAGSTMTFCCAFDLRLPADCALARRRWTASIVSFCCPRNASPSFWVMSSFSFSIVSTCGNAASDFTDGSQVCCCNASSSALPVTLGFCFVQRAACTISSG